MSIPVAPVEHVQLFKVKYSKNVAHRACLSVELTTHPNRQFLGLIVVHMPSCFAACHTSFVLPQGAREPSLWVCSRGGVGDPRAQVVTIQGEEGAPPVDRHIHKEPGPTQLYPACAVSY